MAGRLALPISQPGKPSLARDQWERAQVVAVELQQVERDEHRLAAPAAQRTEIMRAVVADNHGLAIDQERLRFERVAPL